MYSRFPGRPDRPIRIPEHYSGCAFSAAPPDSKTPDPPRHPDTASLPAPLPDVPLSSPEPVSAHEQVHTSASSSASSELPKTIPATGNHFPFSGGFPGGMNFEEMLLIGLIILLARSEENSDMLMWLVLLLFAK